MDNTTLAEMVEAYLQQLLLHTSARGFSTKRAPSVIESFGKFYEWQLL